MTSTEEARIEEAFLSKYALVDNGSDLRGRDVNLTLAWNVMPYIGEHLNTFFPPVTQPFYLRCLPIRSARFANPQKPLNKESLCSIR